MKKVCLIFVLGWICSFESHSQKKNTLDEYNLKGNVVSVHENTYKAEYRSDKWEVGEKDWTGHGQSNFDKEGNITELIEFDQNDRILKRHIFKYDKDGFVKESITSDSASKLITKQVHVRDSKNRVETVKSYDAKGEPGLAKIIEYNESGKPIVEKLTDGKGKVFTYHKSKWEGDSIEVQSHYSSSNELEATIYLGRDKVTKEITEILILRPDNAIINDIGLCYDFDEKGNWISKLSVDRAGRRSTFTKRRFVYR
ncbi:hypothetical protein [Rufibacter hautae]|uniref:Uncharacterized protein n=1 Tax=Rufibacter hautae TaxID=2595005 RepID=A0A5B6TSZ6_9BACT|nr:hypothetical protein [Rufibacter hautae]KAA3439618.1 hypothetical protein FOA19_02770 [Rufibacter hautae]